MTTAVKTGRAAGVLKSAHITGITLVVEAEVNHHQSLLLFADIPGDSSVSAGLSALRQRFPGKGIATREQLHNDEVDISASHLTREEVYRDSKHRSRHSRYESILPLRTSGSVNRDERTMALPGRYNGRGSPA